MSGNDGVQWDGRGRGIGIGRGIGRGIRIGRGIGRGREVNERDEELVMDCITGAV
jgi:hypothetical protein